MSRGSAVVEFALVLPLALVVLLGVVEVAVVARAQLELAAAAREGARHAAVTPDPALAAAAARAALGNRLARQTRVSVTRPHVVGRPAVVRLAARHRVAVPVLGGFDVTLRAQATMRVER